MRSRGTHICQRNLTDSRRPECSRRRERGRGLKEGEKRECLQHFSVASSFFLSPAPSLPRPLLFFLLPGFFFGLFCVISITSDSVYLVPVRHACFSSTGCKRALSPPPPSLNRLLPPDKSWGSTPQLPPFPLYDKRDCCLELIQWP